MHCRKRKPLVVIPVNHGRGTSLRQCRGEGCPVVARPGVTLTAALNTAPKHAARLLATPSSISTLCAAPPASDECAHRSPDPRSVYEDNNPITQVQDPKI